MLGVLLLVAVMAAPESAAGVQIMAVVGRVHIERDGRSLDAEVLSALAEGDLLETDASGKAGFVLADGQAVYLGPATRVALLTDADGRTLRLERGELRVT